MRKRTIKFEVQELLPIGLTLVVAGIGIVYGISVMSDLRSDIASETCSGAPNATVANFWSPTGKCWICPNSSHNTLVADGFCSNESQSVAMDVNASATYWGDASVNASGNAIKGISKLPEKMPLIATVIVAAIIIGILVRYLMVRFA